MNDHPHLLAIIEDKMAQAKSSRQLGDPERSRDLLEQVALYAGFLGRGDAGTGNERRTAGTSPPRPS